VKPLWLLSLALLPAADWPQWRGPDSLGISPESNLPTSWSPTRNIAWKASLSGTGTSSPIVTGDLVIVTSQSGSTDAPNGADPRLARDDRSLATKENAISAKPSPDGKVHLIIEAFKRTTGQRAWQYKLEAAGPAPEFHEKHNNATPTPVTDGKRLYAWFGNGQIVALDLAGKELWKHLLPNFNTHWGHGSSPMLYKGVLIFLCDHRPVAYILALDAATGAIKWKIDRGQGRVSHSTPIIIPGPNGDQMLINSDQRIDAFSPSTGEPLWHTGSARQTPIPSAVYDTKAIYLSRGYRNSDILALDPATGAQKWRMPNGGSYVPSILLYQGLLYMTNEVGVVTCAEAETGTAVWKERLPGIFFASPVAGDGKVYLLSETGEMFVLKAGRKAEVLARNDLAERFLASPAIANGLILLRSDSTLFAIGN
jgi:outer membrane protein assembly factor BamB